MRVVLWLVFPALALGQDSGADALLSRALTDAQAQQWQNASALLEQGIEQFPHDKRFPSEMAGVAYNTGDFEAAKRNLRRALAIDPDDEYANDFLGTLYVLDGNLEAALRYWNRIGKPRVRRVVLDAAEGAIPAAAERSLAIPAGEVFSESRFLAIRSELENLGITPGYRLSLVPGGDGDEYDVAFRPNTIRRTAWQRVLTAGAELPYQTLHVPLTNIGNSGVNLDPMVRWDPNKKRLAATLSVPVGGHPNLMLRANFDGRNEIWNTGDVFGLRKTETGAELEWGISGRLRWTNGAFVSTRRFDQPPAGSAPGVFTAGRALQFESGVLCDALRVPEHRFVVQAGANLQGGPGPAGAYSKAQASVNARWDASPAVSVRSEWRAGKVMGEAPFDEFFMLGMERDTDLWLRGHLATHDGRKGSGPIGRQYFLAQNEISRTVFRTPFVRGELVPFLDVGRAYDPRGEFAAQGLMVDAGIESRFRFPGGILFRVISGFDTRTGKSVIYTAVGR
jgi:hypothetical protein